MLGLGEVPIDAAGNRLRAIRETIDQSIYAHMVAIDLKRAGRTMRRQQLRHL